MRISKGYGFMRFWLRAISLMLIICALVGVITSCDIIRDFGDALINSGNGDNIGENTGNENGDGNGDTIPDEPIGNISGEHGDIGEVPSLSGVDPYASVSNTEFYANYTPATSYEDAYYRTKNGFLSGTISYASGAPALADNRPMQDGMFIRNTREIYSDGGEAYTIVDSDGNPVMTIYKCGAYIALEEVAAYVYAFGTYPPNHDPNKKAKPTTSVFGKYLRVNHSNFSGDTSRYPNEPKLPNANGGGGTLQYKEMDIGGTSYNNGSKITRGAYRIVYAKRDINGNGKYEYGELHVFYTYNHYEDFQEYLNYYGGWSDRFGFETGGSIYAKPSQYVDVFWGVVGEYKVVAIIVDLRKEYV